MARHGRGPSTSDGANRLFRSSLSSRAQAPKAPKLTADPGPGGATRLSHGCQATSRPLLPGPPPIL
eukprot:2044352-Alexandrium_andersonii.AAC.1